MEQEQRDKINKWIHEELLGKCWCVEHDNDPSVLNRKCQKCGQPWSRCGEPLRPDYCSSDSPRSLLDEVLADVSDERKVEAELAQIIGGEAAHYVDGWLFVTAKADQIALALYRAGMEGE